MLPGHSPQFLAHAEENAAEVHRDDPIEIADRAFAGNRLLALNSGVVECSIQTAEGRIDLGKELPNAGFFRYVALDEP